MVISPPSETEIYAAADRLPVAARILVELGQLLGDPRAEADDVIAVLRQDPALTAQIIRMANSAAYAPSEPVGSIERAISFVGFAEVHFLVGAVSARQMGAQHFSLYPIDGSHLRLQTLFVAVLMEEMAKWCAERPQTCYTIGLLRSIGMLALEEMPALSAPTPFAASREPLLDVWELNTWGITNVEVAEKILSHWRMPRETVTAVRHHYRPLGRHNPKIHMLALAASAAADHFYWIPGEEKYWKPCGENFAKAGFDQKNFQVICQKAKQTFERLKLAIG